MGITIISKIELGSEVNTTSWIPINSIEIHEVHELYSMGMLTWMEAVCQIAEVLNQCEWIKCINKITLLKSRVKIECAEVDSYGVRYENVKRFF